MMEVDEALGKLGMTGRRQILHYIMISIGSCFLPCLHMLAINYIGKCTFCSAYYRTRNILSTAGYRLQLESLELQRLLLT